MRGKTLAAALAILGGLLPLLLLVAGCAVQLNGKASLFQREAPARSDADARETLLADVRRLEALGCSPASLEAALRAWDVPSVEASRRANDAYAASRVGARCGGSVVVTPSPVPEIPHGGGQ